MKPLSTFWIDPLVQLFIFVVLSVLVYDGIKFFLHWVWKKMGGDDEGW